MMLIEAEAGAGDEEGLTLGTLGPTPLDPETLPCLQVRLDSSESLCTLTLRGVLCDTSLGALEAQVDQLGRMPCTDVLVDLRQVTQLDTVGAKVLLGLSYYVNGRGAHLVVTCSGPKVEKVLREVAGSEIVIT